MESEADMAVGRVVADLVVVEVVAWGAAQSVLTNPCSDRVHA